MDDEILEYLQHLRGVKYNLGLINANLEILNAELANIAKAIKETEIDTLCIDKLSDNISELVSELHKARIDK